MIEGALYFMGRRVFVSRLSLGFLALLTAWAALGASALHRAQRSRAEAAAFLSDFVELRVGRSGLRQVTPLVERYRGKWREGESAGPGSPCGDGASVVDFVFENRWLHWFLFAPLTRFGATIYVKEDLVCFLSIGMFSTAAEMPLFGVSEFRESPFSQPFRPVLNLATTKITIDSAAAPGQRAAAYAVNLDCLSKLRGCRDAREMAPAVWENAREVAPTLWKSRWDD